MKVTNEQAVGRDAARNFRQVASEIDVLQTDAAALDTRVIALEDDSGWQAPTLLGTWVNYSTPSFTGARYRKMNGRVWIEGLVKDGTTGTAVFVLPSGYRPSGNLVFATIVNPNVIGRLDVEAGGNVVIYAASTVYASLNCSFAV